MESITSHGGIRYIIMHEIMWAHGRFVEMAMRLIRSCVRAHEVLATFVWSDHIEHIEECEMATFTYLDFYMSMMDPT